MSIQTLENVWNEYRVIHFELPSYSLLYLSPLTNYEPDLLHALNIPCIWKITSLSK